MTLAIDNIVPMPTVKANPTIGAIKHISTYTANRNTAATFTPQGIDLICSFILSPDILRKDKFQSATPTVLHCRAV
jgi:hypothetical protein